MKILSTTIVLMLLATISAHAAKSSESITIRGYIFEMGSDHHTILGKVMSVSPGVKMADVTEKLGDGNPSEDGISISLRKFDSKLKDSMEKCKDAIITISADEGNFLPSKSGVEIYRLPDILAFTCKD